MKCQKFILKNNLMKKKVIIIGGSGRLGSNLISNLHKKFDIINLSEKNYKNCPCKFFELDLSKIKDFKFTKYKSLFINVDTIINCVRYRSKSQNENIESFNNAIDIEIRNIYFLFEQIIKINKKLSILNISSTNSSLVSHQFFSYHLSKNLIETLTRYLSVQYLNKNIKINSLRLGIIKTNNLDKILKKNIIKKYNFNKTLPDYKKISEFISYNYITNPLLNGTNLTLDGSLSNIDQTYFTIDK